MKIVLLGRLHEGEISFGPQKVAQQLYLHLLKNNINVEFIEYYFKIYKDSTWFNRFFGYEVFADNVKRLGIIRLFIYLLRTQPDVIHIITLERFILSVFLYKFLLRSKFIVTFHSILKYELSKRKNKPTNYGKFKDYFLEHLAIKYSDHIVFVSEILSSLALTYYKIEKAKISIIPNGIDRIFSESSHIKSIDLSNGLNIVFYNGRDEIDRGFEQLLLTLEKVNVPVNLYVLEGKKQIAERKTFLEIHYVEMIPHNKLPEFLSKMHIVIKSNVIDSFPIFVGECMSMGLIPVLSNKIGISEYIVNGVNGFVYNSENIEEVKIILENIYNGQYDIQTISQNAENIVDELNWNKVAQKYFEVYKSVIRCKIK